MSEEELRTWIKENLLLEIREVGDHFFLKYFVELRFSGDKLPFASESFTVPVQDD